MGFTISWTQWLRTDIENFKRFQWMLKNFLRHSTVTEMSPETVVLTSTNNSEQTFVVLRTIPQNYPTFCKTNRDPYTEDVCIALVLMVEFGIAEEIDAGTTTYISDALEYVHRQYPLKMYAKIKEYLNPVYKKIDNPINHE